MDEATFCIQQGITYYSLPIPDRDVPPFASSTFAFLEQINTALSAGHHVVFHCRQGLGRAALMAASILILREFAPEHAFAVLSQVRGYAVSETEEQHAWVVAFSHHYALADKQKSDPSLPENDAP